MRKEVNGRLALFQDNVAKKWFELAIARFHIHKGDFTENRPEALNLDTNWSAYLCGRTFLGSGLNLYFYTSSKISELTFPGARQHHIRCTSINQSNASQALRGIGCVLDCHCSNDSAHIHFLFSQMKLYTTEKYQRIAKNPISREMKENLLATLTTSGCAPSCIFIANDQLGRNPQTVSGN
jgi:hypothetical protein